MMTENSIAYFEPFGHTETIGFYLNCFDSFNIKVDYYVDDKENVLEYFKNNHNLKINIYKYDLILKNYNKYKLLICGTTDYTNNNILKVMKNSKHKLITVFHTKRYLEIKNYFFKNLVYTPKCIINNTCNYIFPIHNFLNPINKDCSKKKLVIIGQFKYKNKDDFNKIISNINNYTNIEINICVRTEDMNPIHNNSNEKINIHVGLSFYELKDLLDKSHFLIPLSEKNGHYHHNTMSGSLPLSLNHNVPLITDTQTTKIFELNHAITYNNTILEVMEKINNLTQDEYNEIINNLKKDKEKILNYSQNKFMEIIKK